MSRSTSSVTVIRSPAVIRLILGLALLFGACVLVHAQDTVTGAFEGTVTDSQTGNPLKDAHVEIVNQQTNVTISLNTDYRGRFFQGLLLPGTYVVRVSMNGYLTKAAVQLLKITYTGEVVPVPVALDPTPAGTTAAPPATVAPLPAEANEIRASIITTDGRRLGSYSSTEVVGLPVGTLTTTRTFDELALLLPGVAPPPQTFGSVAGPGVGAGVGSAGQFAVNGLRSRANNFTVDGSDNNDEDIGVRRQGFVALIPQPLESIQEYQVITLLAPAQFGRNIGGQVNAVSKSGGNGTHGVAFGRFNSSQLNARNFFDTTLGNASTSASVNNQPVLIQTRDSNGNVTSQQPLMVRNASGDKDSFTFGEGGFVIGGPIVKSKLFYFVSLEGSLTNATEKNSFSVPTIEQRGAFRTGSTGIFQNPLTGAPTSAIPATRNGAGIFSLYPFANNPGGIFGPNTFTQVLPASARSVIFSGKVDHNFKARERTHSFTSRYNFSNDWREIPVTGGAIYSTLRPQIRTQNLSLFLNSQLSSPTATQSVFNQVRLSYGRTRLRFEEVRDTDFLIPSTFLPTTPFLLNAPQFINATTPQQPGTPNTGPVIYVRSPLSVEADLGLLGQVNLAGFSPLGVDVINFPQSRVNNTYQLADELTWSTGPHRFTFGIDTRRTELNSDLPRNARPLVTFNGSPRLVLENGALRFPTPNDINPIIRAEDLAAMGATSNFFQTLNTVSDDASISLRYYQLNFYVQDAWRPRSNISLSYGLRYEYNTPPRELNERIETTFNSPALSFAPGLRQFIDGRSQIFDPDDNNLAPRLGLAYSPEWFGRDHLTVFRAGYGLFYDQILGAVVSQSRNVFPTFLTLNFGGGPAFGTFPLTFDNPSNQLIGVPGVGFVPLVIPGTVNRYNPQVPLSEFFSLIANVFPSALGATLPTRQLETPKAHHYTVSFEQQLSRNLTIAAAYVGTKGTNLLRFTTPNLGPALSLAPTSFSVVQRDFLIPVVFGQVSSPPRPFAGIGAVHQFETTARSNYDSLQLELRGRFVSSVQYKVAYTLSNSMDDVSDVFDLAGAFVLPQNNANLSAEYGQANFDVRHKLSYQFIWEIPRAKSGSKFIQTVFGDTSIASTGLLLTGQPFTVNSTIDVNLDGNLTDRLNNLQGLTVTGSREQPLVLTTANMLSLLAPFGQDGAVGRNTFRAGAVFELDLSLSKKWRIGNGSLILRADIFNLPNIANFAIPVRLLEAAGFGEATHTVTPASRVQFGLKYSF